MAFTRNATHGTWFQEQQSMVNSLTDSELRGLRDNFDSRFEQTVGDLKHTYGVNVMADAKRMLENPEIMTEYKSNLLDPILDELRSYPAETEAERVHMEQVADQLDAAWDSSVKSFVVQESYNVSNYLPLSTLDFPALVKQYIRFLGKEIIPVQTASSTNIEQRIFTKYLVNNQTNEEYETPAIYFKKDTDGKPLWKKLWNAGKGYRINEAMLPLSTIQAALNKKFDIFTWLLDDEGQPMTLSRKDNLRARLSYDFNIQFVHIAGKGEQTVYVVNNFEAGAAKPAGWPTGYYKDAAGTQACVDGDWAAFVETNFEVSAAKPADWPTGYYKDAAGQTACVDGDWDSSSTQTYYKATAQTFYKAETVVDGGFKVKLPGGGIQIDIQNGGVFLNGGITEDMKLAVIDETTNLPTGETKTGIADRLSGIVDFVKGYVTASSCGTIDGIYINGRMSNETNMRTIGFREYPEIRKFLISDGCRFQLPFTVEDFAEANASLNFNLYNRLVQELVTAQEMFEDESILEFLDEEFDKYDGYESDVWALESYTHTEYVDMNPTALSPNFAGDPWEYRTNAIHNSLASLIYELCDRGKLENLGFVIYGNPKAIRLIQKFVTWTVQKSTEIGGVQMNHAFGVMTDFDLPVRVVASNRIEAYTTIPAYQADTDPTDVSREYFYHIVAYPMDKFHISYKHLRFARHLTNSPENAAYADAGNPGGAAVYVTTSAQYKTIAIQGIQGRIIFKNTVLVPDSKAGLVVTTDAVEDSQGTDGNTP